MVTGNDGNQEERLFSQLSVDKMSAGIERSWKVVNNKR